MSTMSVRRVAGSFAGMLTAAACLNLCLAQTSAALSEPEPQFPYVAAVEADEVLVRCGADFGFYAIGQLERGQTLRVTDEKNGFARVALVGPAFDDFFAFLKYTKIQSNRFRLEEGGRQGVTLGRVDVIGPNMQSSAEPAQSWKPLVKLAADQSVRVLDTITTDNETIYKIALPAGAEGWVSAQHLRRATAEEASAFEYALGSSDAAAPARPVTVASRPAVPATPTPVAETQPTPASETQPPLAREETAVPPVVLPPTGADPASVPPEQPVDTIPPLMSGDPVVTPVSTPNPGSITLADLEAAYKMLAAQPLASAEVTPLREQYLAFAERAGTKPGHARQARARAEQLGLLAESQEKLLALAELKAKASQNAESVDRKITEYDSLREYVAVGRLEASTIYDGGRLPKLLRLQDMATGRTIAYLNPELPETEALSLYPMLGQVVGIVGDKDYDTGLRLNVITPKRVDPIKRGE